MHEQELFFVYFVLNTQCQLACEHCYAALWADRTRLNYDKALKFLSGHFERHPNSAIVASLHGGEPFYYRDDKSLCELSEFMDKSSDIGKIYWGATTNLVYTLTPKILSVFDKFVQPDGRVAISTSWDSGDTRFKTQGAKELWESNVRSLLNQGYEITPIVSCTKKLLEMSPESLVDYFVNIVPTHRFNVERITENGRATQNDVRPLNRDLDNWLGRLYDVANDKGVVIPLFEDLKFAADGKFVGCRARQCMSHVLTINNTGTVSTCPNMAIESVIYSADGEYLETEHEKLCKWEQQRDPRCLVCPYYKVCNGDCCQLRWDSTGCPGLKTVITKIRGGNEQK